MSCGLHAAADAMAIDTGFKYPTFIRVFVAFQLHDDPW